VEIEVFYLAKMVAAAVGLMLAFLGVAALLFCLVFVFYICFSPIPSSGGIGPLTGLWFDTLFFRRNRILPPR
jgi:hypothetical protein